MARIKHEQDFPAEKKKKTTFTKKWVNRLLWLSCLWVTLSFILAFMGRENIAETLAITALTEIVAVCLGYFIKSYFETKEEERMKYSREYNKMSHSDKDIT